MNGPDIELYGTDGCHLCETAAELLAELGVAARYVDVAADDALVGRYGVRIPVLRCADGRELDWPFSVAGVAAFLDGAQAPD